MSKEIQKNAVADFKRIPNSECKRTPDEIFERIPDDITVIDTHCHVYPPKIAERAVDAVGNFYSIHMDVKDGTTEGLRKATEGSPIGRFIIHSVATRPDQVASINDFIAAECASDPNMVGFMTLHQGLTPEEIEMEIQRAQSLGLCGIKLHPDTQEVNMDDERLFPIYEIAQAKKLPIIMHCGDYRYDYSHPHRMKKLLHDFPNLIVNAAHFGGWSIFDLAVEYLEDENCYMDMSSSIALLGMRRTEELVRLYGHERILFGSDFPMWNPVDELTAFASANFSEKELRDMLQNNALRFLGEL